MLKQAVEKVTPEASNKVAVGAKLKRKKCPNGASYAEPNVVARFLGDYVGSQETLVPTPTGLWQSAHEPPK